MGGEIGSVCSTGTRDEMHLDPKILVGRTEENRELCSNRIKLNAVIVTDRITQVVFRNV
jgi:hypothetical protein